MQELKLSTSLVLLLFAVSGHAQVIGTSASSDLQEKLQASVDAFRSKSEVPAVAAVLFGVDGLRAKAVSGYRAAGSEVPVTEADLWHLGSITKSFTSTLMARLIEKGTPLPTLPRSTAGKPLEELASAALLEWGTPLGSVIQEAIGTPYEQATLYQLLSHRAGLPPNIDLKLMALRNTDIALTEQRTQVITSVLAAKPVSKLGASMVYSNSGYILAGVIAERLLKDSWEHLVAKEVMQPLGITSYGFGAPGSETEIDQPRGHLGATNSKLLAVTGAFADNPAFLGPAGTLHMTLDDLARHGRAHLLGEMGRAFGPSLENVSDDSTQEAFLTVESFHRLHRPEAGQNYAAGWVSMKVPTSDGPRQVIWHNGSNTMWYAFLGFMPETGAGVIAIVNAGVHNAQLVDRFALDLIQKLPPQ